MLDDEKTVSNPDEDDDDSVEVQMPAKGTKKSTKSKAGPEGDGKKTKKGKK